MLEHQKARPRPVAQKESEPASVDTLSSDELSSVLSKASRIQAEKQQAGREVSSVDQAFETARELGINDEHVREAIEELRRQKARRALFRASTRRRRRAFLRFVASMLGTVAIVAVSAGFRTAQIVAMAMTIPLMIIGFQWLRALFFERYPSVASEFGPLTGECRVCGNPAWQPKATFCTEHRPR